MATASIRDVELVSTGTWSASTGETKITVEDLQDMLAAAADPQVDHAPIKLGHIDPRFDGEPAAGWVKPTRIEQRDGRHTLIGDLVGMPSRLAEVAPTAYRRRSAELLWRARTPAGRTYRAVFAGLALLGVTAPAVKGLADVMTLFKHSDGVTADAVGDVQMADTGDIPPAVADPANHEPATDSQPGGQMLTEARVRELLKLEGDADVEAALRQLVATTEAPEQPAAEPELVPGQQPPAPLEPGTDLPLAEPGTDDEAGVQAGKAEPQLVSLSAANLAQLQADAAAGRQAAETLAAQRREGIVGQALREGRIAPAERATWLSALESNEQGTVTLLSGLSPRFSTYEAGHDAAPEAAVDESAWNSFHTSLFPDA